MSNSADAARRRRFERLVNGMHADLYRYAAWLCRDPGIAEVILQEALLRAWKSLDALREEDAAKQWFLTIVRRENARYFERARPDMVDIDAVPPLQAGLTEPVEDPDVDEMRRALHALPEEYREPLVLQVLMGYSTKEIAVLMGISSAAVLTRLHRARKKLKKVIEEANCGKAVRDSG